MRSTSWKQLRGSTSIQVAALAALCVCLLALGFPEKTPILPDITDHLLLADFVNETSDASLGKTLDQVLKKSLEQSPKLLLYPDQEIRDSLRQMVLDPFAPVTADLARHICVIEKIPGFLVPRVRQLSGSYILSLGLVTVKNGSSQESLADTLRASDEAELIPEVEEMGIRIRRLSGEDQRSLTMTARPLFSRTARVPQALQLYADAASSRARSEYSEEIRRLELATALDPGFFLAHARLAVLYGGLGWTAPALEHASAATANAEETTPRERNRILGTYYLLKDDYPRALEQYQALTRLYPRSWDISLESGDAAMSSGDVQRAISDYEQAVRLNKRQPEPYLRLCMAQLWSGNGDEARRAWQQAVSLAPENVEVLAAGGLLDVAESDVGAAIRSFRQVAANSDPIVRTQGLFLSAQAEIYGGRLQSALATLQAGIEQAQSLKYGFFEADMRLACAQIYLLAGNAASAASACRLVPDLRGDAMRMGLLGRILARAGQQADAAVIAARLERDPSSTPARFQAAMVRGEIALACGRAGDAVREFRQIQPLSPTAAREPLARALLAAGLWEQAEVEYRGLTERKADVLFPLRGAWFTGTWAQILFAHATCLSRLGRKQEARQQFRSYLWVLDGADGDLSSLQEARAFLRRKM